MYGHARPADARRGSDGGARRARRLALPVVPAGRGLRGHSAAPAHKPPSPLRRNRAAYRRIFSLMLLTSLWNRVLTGFKALDSLTWSLIRLGIKI